MRRVLLLAKDDDSANRLLEALWAADIHSVSRVSTMREACVALARQPHDLAIVPLDNATHQMHAFRALQPTLPIITATESLKAQFPAGYEDKFQAMLYMSKLESTLPTVLAEAWPAYEPRTEVQQTDFSSPSTLPGISLRAICREIELDGDVTHVIFTHGRQISADCGQLEAHQIPIIARMVEETWEGDSNSVLVQYATLDTENRSILLFTRPAAGQLITMVAGINASISHLRRSTDRILVRVFGDDSTGDLGPVFLPDDVSREPRNRGITFAVAWRPIEPITEPVQLAIHQLMHEIASANDCLITFLTVDADLIHCVVDCPLGRSSGWVVHVIKDGVESRLQSQFGFEFPIWADGYFATESHQPLQRVVLDLFLENDYEQTGLN